MLFRSPVHVGGDAGIDRWQLRPRAALAPAHQSHLHEASLRRDEQRAAAVALAGVLAAGHLAGADGLVGHHRRRGIDRGDQQRLQRVVAEAQLFLRRPERVVLFIIGALSTHPSSNNFFANRMPAVLWVLAIGSYWTFAHRMYHTWRELANVEAAKTENAPAQEVRIKKPLSFVKSVFPEKHG